MTADKMKELLFSLSWYDCSAYHHREVKRILNEAYPDDDFEESLDDFMRCISMKGVKGCPRI